MKHPYNVTFLKTLAETPDSRAAVQRIFENQTGLDTGDGIGHYFETNWRTGRVWGYLSEDAALLFLDTQ